MVIFRLKPDTNTRIGPGPGQSENSVQLKVAVASPGQGKMMQAASAVLSSKLTFIQRPEFRLPVPAVLLRQQVLPAGPLRLPIDQPVCGYL